MAAPTDTFIASNGVRVTRSESVGIVVASNDASPNTVLADHSHAKALYEFFRAEAF